MNYYGRKFKNRWRGDISLVKSIERFHGKEVTCNFQIKRKNI